jgi:transcriptional regulator with XRE-family HTH domain
MTKIDPAALAHLMERKGLSLQDLANMSKIDKQTLWRIKTGQMRKSRDHTVHQVASALKVDPKVLTGEEPVPPQEGNAEHEMDTTQLNVRISNQARNALHFVEERYNVGVWKVLELAPLLFCWAAEQSLARRRKLLDELEQTHRMARNLEKQFGHISFPTDPPALAASIEAERESIESKDIWGTNIADDYGSGASFLNPFEDFLSEALSEFEDVIEFEGCPDFDYPVFSVCPQEAEDFVGGDKELSQRILSGLIALHEMPKNIRNEGTAQDRARWVKEKLNEFLDRIQRNRISETNVVNFPDKTQHGET